MAKCDSLINRIRPEFDAHAFKYVNIMHTPDYEAFLRAVDITREFIKTRECILYGGLAVDYALRLRGDHIYEETDLPDFDFWVPNYVEATQELIEILVAELPKGCNIFATRAQYIRTLRVSVGANNWVADISYMPADLFAQIPTLTFNGLRIVHPHLQFADMHSSLSFPFDNAPREVITARWNKDIERFNKLYLAYPIEAAGTPVMPNFAPQKVSRDVISHSVLHGFAAFAIYSIIAGKTQYRVPRFEGDNYIIDVPNAQIEIIAHRDVLMNHTNAEKPRRFAQFLDLIEYSTIVDAAGARLVAYSINGRQISYQSYSVGEKHIRVVSIHALLKYFIARYIRAKYFAHTITPPIIGADVYAACYLQCMQFIKDARDETREIFSPSVTVFGDTIIPLHEYIRLYDDITNLTGAPDDVVLPPKNIRATQLSEKSARTNYDACRFFNISGQELL